MNDHRGYKTAEQDAAVIIKLATLPANAVTGSYFDDRGVMPW